MGFIKAFSGALGATFADQWKDFYVPSSNIKETTAVYPAVLKSVNSGRGENYKGNANIITNGSKIVVPENTALITMQDGAITGVIGSGALDIASDAEDLVTFKCSSCGAEVVVDTANTMQARCHWCRHILSVNEQIPNGSVPDTLLPFKVTKEEAATIIAGFVNKRKFFANPKFKKEFATNNIMGVFFPYMLLDVNSHANFRGEGEHQTRAYQVEAGNRDANGHAMRQTVYDADVYYVERDFDLTIQGLSIESNSHNLNEVDNETNNIINAIMPFDTENCVKFSANYFV